ncbi:MAG: hypothetical protein AAF211_31835, partial [Myxococcota bacterium]
AIDSLRAYRPFASPSDVVSLDLRIAAIQDRLADAPPPAPVAPAPTPAPAPSEPVVSGGAPLAPTRPLLEPPPKQTPRWGLVGAGTALAVGFGATAVVTYLRGQDDQDSNNADSYATNRTINNIAVPLAGVSGGLVVLGFALPQQRRVTVAANPTGANVRLKF